jgi:hypothetical protein
LVAREALDAFRVTDQSAQFHAPLSTRASVSRTLSISFRTTGDEERTDDRLTIGARDVPAIEAVGVREVALRFVRRGAVLPAAA